jgi:2-polyprenyl-3-methyl-5-hydroxy-6-metoxy-1,4-benzoquinol methylase
VTDTENATHQVAKAHDAMAFEYDDVCDPWYTHLFDSIHRMLIETIQKRKYVGASNGKALDVGCGTGIQSHLMADAGISVDAFDLSAGLLSVAKAKRNLDVTWRRESDFGFAMLQWHDRARTLSPNGARGNLNFFEADALNSSSYAGGPYDMVVCVGSVLSFVPDPDRVLAEFEKACSQGGVVIIECEMKANFDLVWPLVDRMVGGRLGYEQSWSESLRNLFCVGSDDVETIYPFELQDGSLLHLPIRLFSYRGLQRRLRKAGFRVFKSQAVHCFTNLLPSTTLHKPLGRIGRPFFERLAVLDRSLGGIWPFRRFGCSSMFLLEPLKKSTN